MNRIQEAEKYFNVKIEFLHTSDIPEVNFNRLLAGESTHDLWHAQNKIGYWELVAAGAVLPMGDILPAEYYDNLPSSLKAVEEALKYDGKYWGIVPLPKGPNVDEHQWTVQAISTTLIPVNAKDPEALAALRAFLWQEDDVLVSDFISTHVKNQESADVLLRANQEWQGQTSRLFENLFEKDDFVKQTFRDIAAGQKGAAAAMAEIKPIIQAKLDDLFNQ